MTSNNLGDDCVLSVEDSFQLEKKEKKRSWSISQILYRYYIIYGLERWLKKMRAHTAIVRTQYPSQTAHSHPWIQFQGTLCLSASVDIDKNVTEMHTYPHTDVHVHIIKNNKRRMCWEPWVRSKDAIGLTLIKQHLCNVWSLHRTAVTSETEWRWSRLGGKHWQKTIEATLRFWLQNSGLCFPWWEGGNIQALQPVWIGQVSTFGFLHGN